MWKTDIDHCKGCTCGGKKPIVNRTHWLCQEKNQERLGKTSKPVAPMKNLSKKRNVEENKYRELQKKLLTEDSVCKCCGTSQGLTFSHLVPRSRRPDLIADERNVVFHCLEHHNEWEKHNHSMEDFQDNISIVKELDREYYELILFKNRGGASK